MKNTDLLGKVRDRFILREMSLSEILVSADLAKLGDVYLNFAYSLAQSVQSGKGVNARVPSKILASALKSSGLKKELPPRTSIHGQADAVEALSVYAWLKGIVTLEELVSLLSQRTDDPAEAFTEAMNETLKRLLAREC